MDAFKKCIEATGNPQLCLFAQQTGQLVGGLVECVATRSMKDCFDACLKRCQWKGCEAMCLSALETAMGIAVAGRIAGKITLFFRRLVFKPTWMLHLHIRLRRSWVCRGVPVGWTPLSVSIL